MFLASKYIIFYFFKHALLKICHSYVQTWLKFLNIISREKGAMVWGNECSNGCYGKNQSKLPVQEHFMELNEFS